MLQQIATSAMRFVEVRSAAYGSKGIEQGVDWRQMALRLAQLRRKGALQEAALLETHAVGGIWTPHRLIAEGYSYNQEDWAAVQCRLCGKELDSEEHRMYRCDITQREVSRLFPDNKHDSAYAARCVQSAIDDLNGPRKH